MSVAKRALACVGMAIMLLGGVGALAHTPWGVARWMALTGQACPLGYGADGQAFASSPVVHPPPGTPNARAKPALGFVLQTTRSADVVAWAHKQGGQCHANGRAWECSSVPFSNMGAANRTALGTVIARFDTRDTLQEIIGVTRLDSPPQALEALSQLTQTTVAALGPPTHTVGEASAAFLARGALYQSASEFVLRDYYARIAATNMSDGYSVTQTYRVTLPTDEP